MEIFIIVIIIVILTVIYINNYRYKQTQLMIARLYQISNNICEACHIHVDYQICESGYLTFTDKSDDTIHIVLWNSRTNKLFDQNTLVYALLHEIAHLVSPSSNHEPPFDILEGVLLNKARELGYYEPQQKIDDNYITVG